LSNLITLDPYLSKHNSPELSENMSKNFSKDISCSAAITTFVLLVSSIVGVGTIGVNPSQAVTFGSNLILNSGAESDVGAPDRLVASTVTPTNWTTTSGNFTAARYGGATISGTPFPTATSPGPSGRGQNFFAGGQDSALSSATQVINLSPDFTVIDTGNASFDLSGWFGGYRSQGDNASLTATFRDVNVVSLGSWTIGAVTPAQRLAAFNNGTSDGQTGLLFRSTSGAIPIDTRSILLTLSMSRTDPTFNDGYADNLSLILNNNTPATSVPEPSAISSLLVGGAVVVGAICKRKRKL
jgi:hypothetical protein